MWAWVDRTCFMVKTGEHHGGNSSPSTLLRVKSAYVREEAMFKRVKTVLLPLLFTWGLFSLSAAAQVPEVFSNERTQGVTVANSQVTGIQPVETTSRRPPRICDIKRQALWRGMRQAMTMRRVHALPNASLPVTSPSTAARRTGWVAMAAFWRCARTRLGRLHLPMPRSAALAAFRAVVPSRSIVS